MRPLQVYWDALDGWIIETPIALTRFQAERAVAWVKKIQAGRLADRPREVREQMAGALNNLTALTLRQKIIGPEPVLFNGAK